jgi:hypothetical protein
MDGEMMNSDSSYGKKPTWFWVLVYLVVGGFYADFTLLRQLQNPDAMTYAVRFHHD